MFLLWVGLLTVLVAVIVLMLFTQKQSFHGAVIDPPMPAAEIKLTDQNGRPFVLSDQRKIVLVFFGYTNCPDECPLTMAHLKQALELLGDRAGDVQVAMVATDPARDTAQVLKAWMAKFNPAFLGLLGTPDELAKTYSAYGVMVADGGETHSTFVYVIDRTGNLRLTFLSDSPPQDIAADLNILLREK
jgi:protein SCO1/2